VDLDQLARDAGDLVARLDELRLQLEAFEREARKAAEEWAEQQVVGLVPPYQQAQAKRVVDRSLRIADEVGAWLVGRSPLGLAQRLLPEVRAGLVEVRDLLAAGKPPASSSPPPPARPAP
jgi:hypothetical protein